MWDPHRGPWAMLRHVRAVYNQCCGFAAGVPCGDADARRGNSSRERDVRRVIASCVVPVRRGTSSVSRPAAAPRARCRYSCILISRYRLDIAYRHIAAGLCGTSSCFGEGSGSLAKVSHTISNPVSRGPGRRARMQFSCTTSSYQRATSKSPYAYCIDKDIFLRLSSPHPNFTEQYHPHLLFLLCHTSRAEAAGAALGVVEL